MAISITEATTLLQQFIKKKKKRLRIVEHSRVATLIQPSFQKKIVDIYLQNLKVISLGLRMICIYTFEIH